MGNLNIFDLVLKAVHNYGLRDVSQVRLVVLEPDCTISIIPNKEEK